MKYGNRIAELREQRKLTQEDLANHLGITRAALSHYETNRREPDYTTIDKIANLFSVTVDYLIGRTNNPLSALTSEVREFTDSLELSDEELLKKFALTIDGKKLTPEESKRFIAFVRAERSFNLNVKN